MWYRSRRGRRVSLGAAAVMMALYGVAYTASAEQMEIVVEDNGHHREWRTHGRRSWYLVYTDREIFEVDSSWVFLKFDRHERYRALEPGHRYRVIVAGWHLPPFGGYRNIVEVLERLR